MNRRKFAKSIMGGIGATVMTSQVMASTVQAKSTSFQFEAGHTMRTEDGLNMTLSGHQLPTKNRDPKQFVLTFDVHNANGLLQENIYQLTDHKGVKHEIFMTPVNENQLQAVFNRRTHA
ncbi:DUF6916 family protein [Marinicella rhabdoformis]|uniref:DUF6916 family protein n=1 Tax=Marinicella rhabdoformis TaxID=2580566 RepID=UPI0012AEBA39|nr:hypothetical protein [Marinicella rhabdoformis]